MEPSRRALGAYYTPSDAAEFMAGWVLQKAEMRLLEPSFGDGSFLRAIHAVARQRGWRRPRILGSEISELAYRQALQAGLVEPADVARRDFLATRPTPVDGVVGNPPYVRLRHLPPEQRAAALAVARDVLGEAMDPAGSVWMPFVLNGIRGLAPGGRLAFVLPADLTYVRYARPLWRLLGASFGELRLLRCRERIFEEILQDVVILLAGERGGTTDRVELEIHESLDALTGGAADTRESLVLAEIVAGRRVFVDALLPWRLRTLLDDRLRGLTVPARELVTFNIGYVAGDKTFFHPTSDVVERFALPPEHLRATLTSARRLKGGGLHTGGLPATAIDRLFAPGADRLSSGEERYLAEGETRGVADRYKCRIREPWYAVPGVKVPDVLLSVFSDRPLLLHNDAGLPASNSLLCGYLRPGRAALDLAQAWYTSLTLLQIELQVHSLGGGVLILVPGEAGSIRLPRPTPADAATLGRIHQALLAGDTTTAYRIGDERVLDRGLGLTTDDIALIRAGTDTLRAWRLSSQRHRHSPAPGVGSSHATPNLRHRERVRRDLHVRGSAPAQP